MGVIIPPGYGQAAFVFSRSGSPKPSVFTLGYNAGSNLDPGVQAAAIREAWEQTTSGPLIKAMMGSGWTWQGVSCSLGTLEGNIQGQSLNPVTGEGFAQTCPPNCAVLIRKQTDRGGRKGRGRMFVPPIWLEEGSVDNSGVISNSFLTNIQSRLVTALTGMVTAGYPATLLHEDGSTPTPITSLAMQPLIATQRRRLR